MTTITKPRVYILSGQRQPKAGEHVALRSVEEMWIAELEDDGMLKVRDDEGFTVRVKANTLTWDEEARTWRSN